MNLIKILNKENNKFKHIKKSKYKKILIIAGTKSFIQSGSKKFLDKYLKKKKVKTYLKKNYLPKFEELNQILKLRDEFKPNFIIAIGGGSVMDCAKICNLVWKNKNLKKNIKLNKIKYITKKYCKLLAIPTTIGSGAEVTSGAVIYIDGIKYSIDSKFVKPNFYILNPYLIIRLGKNTKASSGLDAISQAIESLISKKSNYKSVSYAKKSLVLSFKYFLKSLHHPNLQNTMQMSIAANLAGEAINISKTTAPHALSYYFTEKYNISHGHAVFLTFVKFLKYNFLNIDKANCNFNLDKRFKIMIEASKRKNFKDFILFLENIKKKTNLEFNFLRLGINLNKKMKNILKNVNAKRLANNPIKLDYIKIKHILLNC